MDGIKFDRLIGTAKTDENVRAAFLTGSRADPLAKKDGFRDYDMVFCVREIAPMRRDKSWIASLGRIAVMQEPDDPVLFSGGSPESRYAFLMQFEDGTRIDLTLVLSESVSSVLQKEKAAVCLFDKDGLTDAITLTDSGRFYVHTPSQGEFRACANEFWWVAPYVVKGLMRRELLYALYHLNFCLRPELEKMLTWYAGATHVRRVEAGKCGKNLSGLLPPDFYASYLSTFCRADAAEIDSALGGAARLFGTAARAVARLTGLKYDEEEEKRTSALTDAMKKRPDSCE